MHNLIQSDWAEGLHLTVTGLDKDQRRQVRHLVEAAGGRYSPNFSKRCTHLIVSAEQNDASQLKVYLASINRDKWHARAVRFEWLMECATQHRQVAEDAFAVQPPRHEDVSLIQRRLQEVATPTVSMANLGYASSGESALLGASKRCALDTEVHSNITTRSATKQASKRHKHAESQIHQQAVGVDKPQGVFANSMPTAPAARLCQTAPHAKPILAAPSAQVLQQSACLKWSRPVPKAPGMCTTVLAAGRDNDHMLGSHMQTRDQRVEKASTDMSSSGISATQRQKTPVSAAHQSSNTSSSTANIGTRGAETSKLAGRLHAIRADAMHRAWQKQQESQRLVPAATAPSQAHHSTAAAAASVAVAAAAPTLCQGAQTSELGPATATVDARAIGHWGVAGQHHASASQQAVTHSSRPAITASTAAAKSVNPCLASSSAQPTAKSRAAVKPALGPKATSDAQTNDIRKHHGHDLSTDTESLVAKLRALSQGRTDSAQSRVSTKLSGQQEQKNPVASQAANSGQPKPNKADTKAAPPSKRSKQADLLSADATATSYAAAVWEVAAAANPSQSRPNTAQCIQLLEPVHSGTEYKSSTSPQRRSHSLHPHAASPAASNRLRSGYASVAAPIQLNAPTAHPLTAALPSSLPAPTAAAAAAPAAAPAGAGRAPHEQVPASPVQHRLGKPTPLKKGFTPKPSRFRLEAERLSLTPPDKSSSLEKVLFRSPVKAAAAPSTGCSDDAAAGFNDGAARAPEAGVVFMHEAEPLQDATGVGPGGSDPCSDQVAEAVCRQTLVTPANGGVQAMQADHPCIPQGVFAHMRVILDSELSPDESHRMSEAVTAGGGQVMAGSYLGTGASHVVCHPQTAVKWLAMGLSIVSPSWLLRSLAQGIPDRCLQMSLDASRHLPNSARAASPASAAQPAGHDPGSFAHGANLPQDLSNRQARQNFVQQMQDHKALQQWGSAQQALQTPQIMLDEVVWCVSDPPQQARLDNLHAAAPFADVQGASVNTDAVDVEMAECNPQLSATQEACQAELQEIESMCGTSDGAGEASLMQQLGRHLQEEDWHEVLYKAPALTLLMPLDNLGMCGHGSRSVPVPPHGCTRQDLLHSIHNFYQEQLDVSEQLQLMKGSIGAASVVKEVFVEGMPVKRLSLLHSKVNVEGLERVSRDLTGTIYELKLSC